MQEQLERIRIKLSTLKRKDTGRVVFGASKHRYKPGRIYSEVELTNFEKEHNIQLPGDYRAFLTSIGAGGVGPYYGLESLADGLYADLDYKQQNDLVALSKAFMFTEAWNLPIDEDDVDFEQREDTYSDRKWVNGLLRICNYGCGVFINLVVNGQEHGHIWVDGRCNDGGIYPDQHFGNEGRITFLEWYELWLDKSLIEMNVKPAVLNSAMNMKRSWWKKLLGLTDL